MKTTHRTLIIGLLLIGIINCLISICAGLFDNNHVHRYDEWVYTVNPTCTEAGFRERYCSCGDRQESIVAALGHDYVSVDGIEPDCDICGYETYVECTRCDFTSYEEIAALGHDFGEWITDTEATCEKDGTQHRSCSVCHTVEERIIEATGHTPTEWLTENFATCTTVGSEYTECSVCGIRLETRTVDETGHDFGEWVTVSLPTCVLAGLEKRVCSHDETHFETRVVDKTPHTESGWIIDKSAECGLEGERHTECEVCGEILKSGTISALEHDFRKLYNEFEHYLECAVCHTVSNCRPHVWGDNECEDCGYDAGGIKGLEWVLGTDGDYYVFSGTAGIDLDEFEVPALYNGKSVVSIGGFAFNSFGGSRITVPDTVTEIAFSAFFGCNNLQELDIPFIGSDAKNQSHLGYLFGSDSFENNPVFVPASLKKVILSGNLIRLEESAFKNCTAITEIILPASLDSLGAECFYNCKSLVSVVLPANLKTINSGAFWACCSLSCLEIPESVVEIGKCAFYGVADNCNIVFGNKSGWYLYDGDLEISDITEDFFAEENADTIIQYNLRFVYKRKEADGV